MELTDGMEYQLTKIAKTHHHGRGEVVAKCYLAIARFCLAIARLNWTVMSSLCFLASYQACTQNVMCVDNRGHVLAVWMSGDMCVNWNKPKAFCV